MALVDANGNEVPGTPEWHQEIDPNATMVWNGMEFDFIGIDPKHDMSVLFFKYRRTINKPIPISIEAPPMLTAEEEADKILENPETEE